MGRFNRFLHLERERPAPASSDSDRPDTDDTSRAARFDALETGAEPAIERTEESARELPRFETPVRQPELTLQRERGEDQPFIRCANCEGDSNRFARECQHCHADLDTPAQRAFNERLWSTLRAQREEEAEAQARALAERQKAAEQEARERRALYEQMARDIRRQTEADLASRMGDTDLPFRFRGRPIRMGPARVELAALGAVVLVVFAAAGIFGSWRAVLGLVPMVVIAGGALAVRHFLRGRG